MPASNGAFRRCEQANARALDKTTERIVSPGFKQAGDASIFFWRFHRRLSSLNREAAERSGCQDRHGSRARSAFEASA